MLTHLAIALIGASLFLRIVAKEKNRRERYLLLRLAEHEKRQAEQEALAEAAAQVEAACDAPEEPVVAKPAA